MLDHRLATFLAVAKTQNYTKAAEILNLTQPAVSQQIKYIEDYYGVQVFRKKGRNNELTPEGQILYRYVLDIAQHFAFLDRDIKNKSAIIKKYHLGATLTIGEYVLPKILGQYKNEYNAIDLILQVNNTALIKEHVLSGELDLGLVEGSFDRERFYFQKFKEDELILVAAPFSELGQREQIELKDLPKERLILREKGSGTREAFETKLVELGYDVNAFNIYMDIGSLTAIKSLVISGLGCTVISREAVRNEIKSKEMKRIKIKGVKLTRTFNFIYTKDGPQEFIQSFIGFARIN